MKVHSACPFVRHFSTIFWDVQFGNFVSSYKFKPSLEDENSDSDTHSEPPERTYELYRLTDKYWIILLVVGIIVAWMKDKGLSDAYHQDESDCNTIANSTFNSVPNEMSHMIYIDRDTFALFIDEISRILTENWILNVIMCNPAFFYDNYERSGFIVFWANLLFSTGLIIYSLRSLNPDKMYLLQLPICVASLFICLGIDFMISRSLKKLGWEYSHESTLITEYLSFWVMIIFCIIAMTRMIPFDLDELKDEFSNKEGIISRSVFMVYPLSFLAIVITIMCTATISANAGIHLANEEELLEQVVEEEEDEYEEEYEEKRIPISMYIPLEFYLILTYYNVVSMMISNATSRSYDREYPHFIDFFHAGYVWHYLGSAAYQATLILPRIHSTFIMNEMEFVKDNPNLSIFQRFYLTHWKAHDLSLTMSATYGTDYSSSMRELLELFTSDSPKLKYFNPHRKIMRSCCAMLMAILNLTVIILDILGIILDFRYSIQIWIAFVVGMGIANIFIGLFDAVLDTLWLRFDDSIQID